MVGHAFFVSTITQYPFSFRHAYILDFQIHLAHSNTKLFSPQLTFHLSSIMHFPQKHFKDRQTLPVATHTNVYMCRAWQALFVLRLSEFNHVTLPTWIEFLALVLNQIELAAVTWSFSSPFTHLHFTFSPKLFSHEIFFWFGRYPYHPNDCL